MSKLVSYKNWHLLQMLKEVPYSSVSLHKGGFLAILKSTVDPDPFPYVSNSYNSRALILRVHCTTLYAIGSHMLQDSLTYLIIRGCNCKRNSGNKLRVLAKVLGTNAYFSRYFFSFFPI